MGAKTIGRNRWFWLVLFAGLSCALAASPPRAEEKAADSTPSQKSYLLWREGYLLHLRGDYDGAIERFGQSIESYPTAEAYTYLGWSLSKLGHLDEAIAACKAAIRIDPDYGNPYNDIGAYLIRQERLAEAIPWLQQAIRAGRYCCYQFPFMNLGRALLMLGRVPEAKRFFEKALSIAPGYEPALKALELIRRHGLEST